MFYIGAKRSQKTSVVLAIAFVAVALLPACGGGSSSAKPPATPFTHFTPPTTTAPQLEVPEPLTRQWCLDHTQEVVTAGRPDLVTRCVQTFSSDTSPPAPTPAPPPPPTVTYDLTGQGAVSVTLQNASGGTEQFETGLPYHLDLGPAGTFGGLSGFVYISAQLQNSGTVTCTIKKGEQVIQTATSSGQYVIATCSGSV
jgi:hypothetical protein